MDTYYTYVHTSNDIPFYVGEGCNDRYIATKLSERSKEWHLANKENFSSLIIAYGTKDEMLSLEATIIKRLFSLGFPLVNKHHSPEWISPFKGLVHKNQTKLQMAEAKIGKSHSEEHKLLTAIGVCKSNKTKGYIKDCNKYYAKISIDGKLVSLGSYYTPEEAHQAFLNAKAKRLADLELKLLLLQTTGGHYENF